MLHVILQILAIIGIVLLCVLGLVLLLVLLVLFVPVRYRLKGSKSEKDVLLQARASFLLHLLTVRFDYPEPASLIVRLAGIKVFASGVKEKEEKPPVAATQMQEEQASKGQKAAKESAAQDTLGEQAVQPVSEEAMELTKREQAPQQTETARETSGGQASWQVGDMHETDRKETPEPSAETEKQEKENSFLKHPVRWIQEKFQKLKNIVTKIWYTIRSICDKIKHIVENISYYREVLSDTENQKLYKRVWCRLFKVLKSIRPRVLKADLRIGTGSPDTTGYLCALYGMLLPVLGNNVNMEADFEEAVLNGNVYLKGRITVFTILLQAGKILLDKQLRIFIKELKREE